MTTGKKPDQVADLTWQDLAEWGGSRIVSRGKSYTKRVLKLRVTPEDGLLATVVGTRAPRKLHPHGFLGPYSSSTVGPMSLT